MDNELSPGRLLSGEELRRTLKAPDRVFHNDTWDPRNLITSGYYARLSGSPLVIPNKDGGYRSIQEADESVQAFRLRPGESAVISTIECFSIGLDISVSIGQRFGEAAQGLLMLHGSTAHPGYGMRKNDDGSWTPLENVRLYFVVANVGPTDIELRRFEKIAYLQFFSVSPDRTQEEVPSKGYAYLRERLHDAQDAGGLSFFRTVRDTETNLAALAQEVSSLELNLRNRQEKHQAVMDEKVRGIQTTAERVSDASNFVVVFGVFLVAAAILGVTLESLSSAISEAHSTIEDWRDVAILILVATYGIVTIFGVAAVATRIAKVSQAKIAEAEQTKAASAAPARHQEGR